MSAANVALLGSAFGFDAFKVEVIKATMPILGETLCLHCLFYENQATSLNFFKVLVKYSAPKS